MTRLVYLRHGLCTCDTVSVPVTRPVYLRHGLCTRDFAALTLVVAMFTVAYQLLSFMLLLQQKGAALVVDVFDAHYKIHEIPNGIEVIANRNYLYMSRV